MIQITLNCASVAELHATLRALLQDSDRVVIATAGSVEPRVGATYNKYQSTPKDAAGTPAYNITQSDPLPLNVATANEVKTLRKENPDMGMHEAKEAAEKPKRTRRTKAEIEAAKAAGNNGSGRDPEDSFETKQHDTRSEEAPAPQTAAPTASGTVNKEMVHQALQQVNVAVNLQKAREILTHFKVNRISEIKEDQYQAFIDKCNEAVMLEG